MNNHATVKQIMIENGHVTLDIRRGNSNNF